MIRLGTLGVLAVWLTVTSVVDAQTPCRFRWQSGQVLHYRFDQVTQVSELVSGTKADTMTKIGEIKRWQVMDVDGAGVATVQLSLTKLRIENTTPSGEVLLFDSADPDKSNPQMKEQLSKFVGQPLAVLRIDGRGRVLEVKESKHGPATRYESEPPFVVVFPEGAPQPGQFWERPYQITVEPPQGTNEKHGAIQKYTCKSADDKAVVLSLHTSVPKAPVAVADRVPLLHLLPEGEIVFDSQSGMLRSARLKVERELTGHQGEGSTYRIASSSTEEYLSNP